MTDYQLIFFGIMFIFVMTTLGSLLVLFFKNDLSISIKQLCLGFASGIMIASSVWSLLIPALSRAENMGLVPWVPVAIGFIAGGILIFALDYFMPHQECVELHQAKKLFLAVTLHNIPEGLAVGLAYGLALYAEDTMMAAIGLAIGIGLQNFPEGLALALPLKETTNSKTKGFLYGTLSGAVEPVAAVLGLLLVSFFTPIMPWALGFAAGAMIYVTANELIPAAHNSNKSYFGTIGVMVGFLLMMVFDIAL